MYDKTEMYDQLTTKNEQLPEQLDLKFYKIYMSEIVHWINFDLNICYWVPTKRKTTRVWKIHRNTNNPQSPHWEWFNPGTQEFQPHYGPFSDEIEKLYKQWQADNILIKGIGL